VDEIVSHSANVQDVIDITNRWNRLGGEFSQFLYGDRSGNSVIIDGDTILRKQGTFQLATNFRLVDNPNPPYPQGEERYGKVFNMLAQADHFTVDLFEQALDVAHAEGDYPTLYSQVYELKPGKIHLYQYHDFQHEVVLDLADELAKGPHTVMISSLFPRNNDVVYWTAQQVSLWKASYAQLINTNIKPESQRWMSGEYVLQGEAEPVTIYLERDQLYLQKPNQLPIELYPSDTGTLFHQFFNGMNLTLTFERNLWGQATGAQGTFSFDPYEIAVPYDLTRPGALSYNTSVLVSIAGVSIVLLLFGFLRFVMRRLRASR
jgi:hypothetical protein